MKTFFVLVALVAMALAKPNLKPHKHHWIKNFRFTEYRGVQVNPQRKFGKHGPLQPQLQACAKHPKCSGLTEGPPNRFTMVNAMQLGGAGKKNRVFHKSGKRQVRRVQRTVRIQRVEPHFGHRWGLIEKFHFAEQYGKPGPRGAVMKDCAKDKGCFGVNEHKPDEWRKGKGNKLKGHGRRMYVFMGRGSFGKSGGSGGSGGKSTKSSGGSSSKKSTQASVSYTYIYGGYSWGYKTNQVLGGGYLTSKKYTTRKAALTACYKNSKCKGVSYLGSKNFRLMKGTKVVSKSGGMYWLKKGSSVTYSGRVWTHYTGYYITGGKASTKAYTDLYSALVACGTSSKCNGVNKESSTKYYLMKKSTVKAKSGKHCYIQGDAVDSYGGYSYTTLSGYYLGGWLSSTVYTSKSAALAKCSANSKCTGITKIASKKYKLNSGSTVKSNSKYTLYPKGGMTTSKYRFVYANQVFTAHSPYKLSGAADKKTYTTRSAALDACMGNSKCVGFTQYSTKKYKLNTKRTLTKSAGYIAYRKDGLGVIANGYLWQRISGKKLKGTVTKTTYTTFAKAAKACASSSACKGVTYVSAKKYQLNSTVTRKTAKGQMCWVKRGKTVAYKSYYWTALTGYKGQSYISTTSYSSLNAAKVKCLASSKCGGVTKVGSKYYLNKYYAVSSSSGSTVYQKGGAKIAQTVVYLSFSGYTWKQKSPWTYAAKLSTKKYTTRNAALKACAKNSKCTGIAKTGSKAYYLGKGTSYKPAKGQSIFIKYGAMTTYGGYTWTAKTNYSLSGGFLSSTVYTSKSKALAACKANSKCKGVIKTGTNKYKLGKGASFSKKTGYSTYKKTSEVKSYSDYYWTVYSDYKLSGALKSYTTLSKAMKACTSNSKCNGVTTHSSKVHKTNSGANPASASGKTAYIKGSAYSTKYSLKFGSKMFLVHQPYKLGSPYGSKIKSRAKAWQACLKDKNCKGFTRYGSKNFKKNKSTKKTLAVGHIAYIKSGNGVTSGGRLWGMYSGYKLSGYADKTTYKSDSKAMTACSSNSKCNGITKEGSSKYRINTGSTPSKKSGMNCYLKGYTIGTSNSKYWTTLDGYKFNKVGTKKYTTLSDAKTACKKATSGCRGVGYHGSKKYYLGTSPLVTPKTGYNVYFKGGPKIAITTVSLSYGGYTWNMKKPMTLSGKLSKTKYTTRNKALKACKKNSKCNGVVRTAKKSYYIYSGSTPMPGKGKIAFVKSGKSTTYASTIWTTKSGSKLKGAYSTKKYTSRNKALKACAAASGCKGVTKYASGNFKLRKSTTLVTASGKKSWVQGSSVTESNDTYWTTKSNYKMDTKLSKTAYKTKAKAFKACAAKGSSCTGVSKISKKYYIMTGSGITSSTGSKSYVKGDYVKIYSYMILANKAWLIKAPYKLSGSASSKTYTTAVKAAEACMKNKKCKGFTRESANKFKLNSSTKLTSAVGKISYIKKGGYVQYGGRVWPKLKGYKFTTRYGSKTYTSDSAAMSACKDSTSCYGVTKTGSKKYTLGASTTLSKKKGQYAYLKGDKIKTSSKIYWSKKSGYKLNTKLSSKKYTDLDSALAACAAKSSCQGVVKDGSKKYYMYKDAKLTSSASKKTWLKGGAVIAFTTMTVSSGGYSWTYKNPFKLSGSASSTKYTSLTKALKACGSNSSCKGVTYNGNGKKKYRLNTGGTAHPGKAATVYIKSGKSTTYGGYQWTKKSGKKLSGYYKTKTYTSKKSALKKCAAAAGCKGVTKEGTNKYKLNSSTTYSTVSGMKIWIKGSGTESSNSYNWTPKKKYALGSPGKTVYKTKAKAAKACAKKSTCTGYTKYGDKKWKINSGSNVSSNSKATAYVKGGYSKTSHSLFFANRVWFAKGPYKFKSPYGSTYSKLSAVLAACMKDKKCQGFNYDGSNFKKTKTTTAVAAVGYTCYEKSGAFVSHDGYMWSSHPNTKLSGYFNSVTYTSDSKAYAACSASSSCKGITKEGKKKYRTNTGSSPSTKKGYNAYVQGNPFKLYKKYYWTIADGYRLKGYASTTKYTSQEKAMKACLTNSKCNGITKEGSKNYKLNTGYTLYTKSSMTAYIKGGDAISLKTYSTTNSGYTWTYKKPFKLTGYADKVTYKTVKAALAACAANSKCLGVTKQKAKTFRLNTSATARPGKGMTIWVKKGAVVKQGGYTWSKNKKKKLSGYYSTKTYKTLKKALKACAKSSGCKGVTKEASKKYKLNSSTTKKTNSASTAYVKGGALIISSDYYWTEVSGYKFKTNLSTKKYTTKAAALAACAAKSSTCSGVSYIGKKKYYLGKGSDLSTASGNKVYVIGSKFVKTWTVIAAYHVWQAKSPYKHTALVTSKTYTTQGKAVAAIMKSKGKYKGFTRISAGKYQVSTKSGVTASIGKVAFTKLGKYVGYGSHMWAQYKGKKLAGYSSTTKYSTLAKAMAACLSSDTCNGVTKEGTKNFKCNTGKSPQTASGKTCYLKGTTYALSKGVYWTEIDGVKLTGYASKTTYKTLSKAKSACKKSSKCNGITYQKAKTYRINTGDKPVYASGMKVYYKGGQSLKQVKYGMTYGDYAWTVKKPYVLKGSASKTTYTTKKKALTACIANSKCNGVTYKSKKYYLNTGATPMPAKGTKVFIKGGKSVVGSGKSWTTLSSYSLGGLGSTTYATLTAALAACVKSGTCKGVVKNKKGKYQLATKSTKSKKTGYTSYSLGSTTYVLSDYTWTVKTDYTLSGYVNKTKYKTLAKALAACAKSSKCNGVTKEGTKNYRINTGDEPSSKSGRKSYVKGGLKSASRTEIFANQVWKVKTPYKLTKGKVGTAKTRKAAFDACMKKGAKCAGFTRTKKGSYILYSKTTATKEQGKVTWIKQGQMISSSGYMWAYKKGYQLSGYDSTTKYSSAKKAFTACKSSSTCNGVTYHGSKNYRTNTGSTPSKKSGKKCWIKGDAFGKTSSYYFSKKSGYTLDGVQTKKYTSAKAAKKACVKAKTCTGVVKKGSKKFYLATGYNISDKSGYTAYNKGGKEISRQSYTLSSAGYTWNYVAPFRLSGGYATKKTITKALKACAKASKCNGVYYKATDKKYYLATGSTAMPGKGARAWIKQGNGNTYQSKKTFASYDGYKLKGYASTKTYTTKKAALKKCASTTSCNGVTKEAKKKYKLNTGKVPYKQSGMKCWVKAGSYTTMADYRFAVVSGYVSTVYLTKTVYKTLTKAQKACAANAKCTGVTKVKKSNYRLNKGGAVKTSSGAKYYPKGKYYKTRRTVSFANRLYIAKSPMKMSGTKLGSAKTIMKAMVTCQKLRKSKGCNGFHWNGKTFTVYKYTKLTKPAVGYVAYIAYGTTIKSSSYFWAMKSGYRLTGYDSGTTYKTLTKATDACVKSTTCKGVTKEASKKYRINNDNSPSKKSGMIAYIRGDKYVLKNKIYYSYVPGVKFTEDLAKTTYTTLAKAATACKGKSTCSGITYTTSTKKYRLNKGNYIVPSAGESIYVRGGVQPTFVKATITYGGYTWGFKSPYRLTGYVNTTKYTALNKALKACAANSKCKGVSYTKKGKYRLNTGSTALPAGKGSKIWVKGGVSYTYASYSWGKYPSYTLGGMIGKTYYTTLAKALAACKKSSKCKGVVKNSKNKYFLVSYSKSKKTKKTSYTLYYKGAPSYSLYGYTYTLKPNYVYTTYLVKTVYKTLALAGKACASKGSSCTGIVYLKKNNYKLTKGNTMKASKGKKLYIKGGFDYTSRDIYFADTFWTAKYPYTLSGTKAYSKTFTKRDDAIRMCLANSACNGFTLSGGKYSLYKSSKLTESAGKVSWLKKGAIKVADNYHWDKEGGKKLSGYYSTTTYKTLAKATKACSKSTSCGGVTKEASKKYRLNTGSTFSTKSSMNAWRQGDPVVMYGKTYYTKKSGFKLSSIQTKKSYASAKKAGAACNKARKTCSGFVLKSKKYYLTKGWVLYTDSDYTAYVRNDRKLNYSSYTTYQQAYFWTVKAPYIHKKLGKTGYSTKAKAMKACVKKSSCKGISYLKPKKKYYLSTTALTKLGPGKAYTKGGKGKISDGYIWNPKSTGTKISGDYLSSTTYTTLAKAFAACAKNGACTGATKTASKKYRLGKKATVEEKSKMVAYLRGNKVVTYKFLVWVRVKGRHITSQGKTSYKTYKKAMIACKKSSKCTGVNYSASGKYYTATGSDIVPKDGKKCWLKGGAYKPYFTYDKTVWYYGEDYKTSGTVSGAPTLTSRNKAMSLCARNPMCNSVHYTSKKYYLRTGKKFTDKAGDKAWLQGKTTVDWTKVYLPSNKGLWQPRPGYYLKTKIGKTTYTSFTKATKACYANSNCKGLTYVVKTKKYTLRSTGKPIKKSGHHAYPRKYPCDNKCKAVKKGKVYTVNMKYCFTVKSIELSNKHKCCSKNKGNVAIKVGSKSCGTVSMSGKTTAVLADCASGAKGKKVTLTFANVSDINIEEVKIHTEGAAGC